MADAGAAPLSAVDAVEVMHHVARNHPAFAGHFPGRPILPGVLLLSEVLEAAQCQPGIAAMLGPTPVLESVKFLAPVAPESELRIVLRPGAGALQFEVRAGAAVVARGRWMAGAAR